MKMLGMILVVLGFIGVVWGGITYTKHEKVLDVGPLEVTTHEKERIPLPPIAGALALAAGVVLLATNRRSTT